MNGQALFNWLKERIKEAKEMQDATTCKYAKKMWQGKINAYEDVLANQGYYKHGQGK